MNTPSLGAIAKPLLLPSIIDRLESQIIRNSDIKDRIGSRVSTLSSFPPKAEGVPKDGIPVEHSDGLIGLLTNLCRRLDVQNDQLLEIAEHLETIV